MSDDGEKPFVKLENTKAATTDEEGNSRVRMEALSKGGEKRSEEEVERLTGTRTSGSD